jgi:hypothetical protein
MEDHKLPEEGRSPLPGQWQSQAGDAASPAFVPLRLVLYPGGCTIELNRPDMVVGRHSTADVRLHLPDVSRRHCRFAFTDGVWEVFDLHSMNGVYVNDERVEQAVIHHRDLIRVGSYIFEADLQPETPAVLLPANGLNTLERIAGALPPPEDPPRRKAS